MLDENPYRPTLLSGVKYARGRVITVLWWLLYLQPTVALALIYSCWMITTASLGRPPGFGEHPQNALAHSVVHALDMPAMLLILGSPALIPIALICAWAHPFGALNDEESTIQRRFACVTAYILMSAIIASICSYDPLRVVYWYVD